MYFTGIILFRGLHIMLVVFSIHILLGASSLSMLAPLLECQSQEPCLVLKGLLPTAEHETFNASLLTVIFNDLTAYGIYFKRKYQYQVMFPKCRY